MTAAEFRELLEQLPDGSWRAIIDGAALLLVDDQGVDLGSRDAPNAIVTAVDGVSDHATRFRARVITESEEILAAYYRTHPVTQVGFNRQVVRLIEEHGAESFAAAPDTLPELTLFVDGGVVVAEPSDSPRHRYGTYCELDGSSRVTSVAKRVQLWVESDEAYQSYLSMNVCRYSC